MTAEIAIINKSAVALAADSKVTLSRDGKQKTYDTVNKLFSLSKKEPIGAMIYGNAEFMRFPWETIIKEYRRRKPGCCFDTVFDWADDVQLFLTNFFQFNEEDGDLAALSVAQSAIQSIIDVCMAGAAGETEFSTLLSQQLTSELEAIEGAEDYLSPEEWSALNARIGDTLEQLVTKGILARVPQAHTELKRFAELSIIKAVASPSSSGLVVAGFGEKELLPSIISFEIDGLIAGRLKAIEDLKFDATRNNRGIIQPFAQTDMVHRFMQGIDPDYAYQLHNSIGQLLLQNAKDVAQFLGHDETSIQGMLPSFENASEAAAKAFWEFNERYRRERFAAPIIEMTMSLPKDELANLAESLVSLTSLQRRVSREIETVGGAIDVAVISKGDGFVWIKRKHYFSADRNLRFVNGYFSDFISGQKGGRPDDENGA